MNKVTGISTSLLEIHSNIALRQAKREYYSTKFQNPKTIPKHAWQTIIF